ncbi:heavy metal-associated isoprenylated plant protein 47-like [Herrania umbratica]|uniref:Heavy metal-associated isoprenylated plant protein 47-like n=1 Tax=Herrania umbratica TaxID=108875 RepID=A0A6J1AKE0_9ROSI|nr:heavy metal-associated isoprenylated plant protein 47-like [Herrania umbratica]
MKQKIIIKVSMHCSKCRTKAMKIASVADGVTSVALHGPEKDKLMIEGDGVDAACLTSSLRKKLCHASLEIVEEVKEKNEEPPKSPTPIIHCPQPQPQFEYFTVVSEPPPGPCTIM